MQLNSEVAYGQLLRCDCCVFCWYFVHMHSGTVLHLNLHGMSGVCVCVLTRCGYC